MAIADGGNGYMPSKHIRQFITDLDVLPFVFAAQHDIVLTEHLPEDYWLQLISTLQIPLPRFLTFDKLMQELKKGTVHISECCPWGWSPRMIKLLEPIKSHIIDKNTISPNFDWSLQHKEIYGRQTALDILKTLLSKSENKNILLSDNLLPVIAATVAETVCFINKFERVVLKTPYSSSGRGILILREKHLNHSNIAWISGNIRKFGFIMAEPYLDKTTDVSAQFYLDHKTCKFAGMAFSIINTKGGYTGNYIKPLHLDVEATSFLNSAEFNSLISELAETILCKNLGKYYRGYLGVDMMICKSSNSHSFIHPCLEINLRYTMGTLSCFLEKFISKSSYGVFQIIDADKETKYLLEQQLHYENKILKEDGKIAAGILPLTPWRNKKHIAILKVEKWDKSTCNCD